MIDDVEGLWALVERRAEATPERVFLVDEDGRTLTFAGYRDACLRVAAGLHDLGVRVGDPVSWLLPTWIEAVVLVGALARLGAVQNPMLPIYREREVGFVTRQTGARLLVTPGEWRGFDYAAMARAVVATQPGLEALVCEHRLPEGDPASLPAAPPPPADPADAPVRWVFYTSGTTADPKGARHTDATIRASATGMIAALALTDDDVVAMVFPFTHIGGQTWTFAGLITGCRLVLVEAFVPDVAIPVLRREGVTVAGAGTPFHLAYLAAQRAQPGVPVLPRARVFPGGGAPKPPQLHAEVKRELGGVGIVAGYGLTECPIFTMAKVTDPDEELAATEGGPTPGVRLKIVTLDGRVAGVDEEGEIRVVAPQLFHGYVDGSLDADAFDDEGFFRTGDLGRLNAHGNIVITGRLKDVIIRKGENISAKEVEDLLFGHPKVGEAAVVGLPDPQLGERCCAVVVPADPADPPGLLELADYLRGEGCMVQKIPEQLEIVAELPRNPAGKVLKQDLRARYADA